MPKIILEKSQNFDLAGEYIKKTLKQFFKREFRSIEELVSELYKQDSHGVSNLPRIVYFPKEKTVEIDTLPFTIKEWPLYYQEDPIYGKYEIARAKVKDSAN